MSRNTSDNAEPSRESQIVPVRIAGHEYKIRSTGDPEQLQQLAGYVDRSMARVRERTGTVDTLDVAVLTCLNLSREILSLRERGQENAGDVLDPLALRTLIEQVEAAVVPQESSRDEKSGRSANEANEKAETDASPAKAPQMAKTLELPSPEALRERGAAAQASDVGGAGAGEELEDSRVAAGGRRDRAS